MPASVHMMSLVIVGMLSVLEPRDSDCSIRSSECEFAWQRPQAAGFTAQRQLRRGRWHQLLSLHCHREQAYVPVRTVLRFCGPLRLLEADATVSPRCHLKPRRNQTLAGVTWTSSPPAIVRPTAVQPAGHVQIRSGRRNRSAASEPSAQHKALLPDLHSRRCCRWLRASASLLRVGR